MADNGRDLSGRQHVDVAIVGARVAGSNLAARLAAGGLSVAVFDRDTLPGPTLSTHILHGTEDLRAEGVYDDVLAAGVPPLHDVWVRLDTVELRFHHPDNPGMCTRREVLDQILLDRAVAAGAKVFLGTAVVGVLGGGAEPVRGLRLQNPDGSSSELTASLVVGADGRNSSVARWVGAQQYLTTHSERSLVWRYFRGKQVPPALYWHRVGEHIASILPTGPAEFLLISQPPERLQGDIAAADADGFLRHIEQISPVVADLARGGEPDGPAHRIVRYPFYFRQPYGPGWALVGDAGHSKDATVGHGINDALRNTRALATVLLDTWADPDAMRRQLATWAKQRDRAELPNFWYGQDIGRAIPVTTMEQAILVEVQRSPRALRQLDDVMGDRLAADRLLTLGRLVSASVYRIRHGARPRGVAAEAGQLIRLAWRRKQAMARRAAAAPALNDVVTP